MNYMQIDTTSISNGLGFRVVLWCSGCTQQCKNCFNPQTWDFNAGKPCGKIAKQNLFEALNKPYVKGITFSGGHPLEKENMQEVFVIARQIKEMLPDKDIWLYTGYTLEYENFTGQKDIILDDEQHMMSDLLLMCDVIVDGRYIEEQRDVTLAFRGSKNQRLIDVKQTLAQGRIITLNES